MASSVAVNAEQRHIIDPLGVEVAVGKVMDLEPLRREYTPTTLAPSAIEQDDVPAEPPPVWRPVVDGELLEIADPMHERFAAIVIGVWIEETQLAHGFSHLMMTPSVVVATKWTGSLCRTSAL